jgi:hypothetical protein
MISFMPPRVGEAGGGLSGHSLQGNDNGEKYPSCELGDSRQFGKQDRRLLQIGGVEPFGEPAIERCQQFACLLSPALFPQ